MNICSLSLQRKLIIIHLNLNIMNRGNGNGGGTGNGGRKDGSGFGSGNRGGRNNGAAAGPGGYCECVKCGNKQPHQRGVKCTTLKCEKCGHTLIRDELIKSNN